MRIFFCKDFGRVVFGIGKNGFFDEKILLGDGANSGLEAIRKFSTILKSKEQYFFAVKICGTNNF